MYIMTDSKGNQRIFTAEQIIQNAEQQKAAGIAPAYRYYYGKQYGYSEPGYLIVSLYSGCIVAIEHRNGNFQIVRGWQGDFSFAG